MAQKGIEAGKRYPDLDVFSMLILVKGPKGELGGFTPRFFIQKITERCMCCYGVPRSPYSASCGHSVCRTCLFNFVLTSHNPSCFICQTPMLKEECYPDLPLSRRVNQLEIRCPFVATCEWMGLVEHLRTHFSICAGVNGLFRSWMESIQAFLSNLQNRSSLLERRVDQLEMQIRKHQGICQQRYIEQDGRSKHLTGQLIHLREQCQVQPKNAEIDPELEDGILKSKILLEIFAALALDIQEEEQKAAEVPEIPPSPPQPAHIIPPPQPRLIRRESLDTWRCLHCCLDNPVANKICQVCYRTHDAQHFYPWFIMSGIWRLAQRMHLAFTWSWKRKLEGRQKKKKRIILSYKNLLLFQWTLTSQESGEYPICFHTLLSDLYSSLPYCVIISVLEVPGRKVPAVQLVQSLNYTSGYDSEVTLPSLALSGELSTAEHAFVMIGGKIDAGESLSFTSGALNTLDVKSISSSLLLITGEDSLSVYSQALASVSYRNEEQRSTSGTRYLIFGIFDGTYLNNLALQYFRLTVSILNKPPTISLSGDTLPYEQRFVANPIYISHNTQSTLSDPDSVGIHNATISISPLLDFGVETLTSSFTSPGLVSMPIIVQEIAIDIPFGYSQSGELHSHITHNLYVNDSSSLTVGDLDIVVYIDHSWIGDITLELEHDGLRRTLVTQPGGALCSQDNLFHVVFDEEADVSLGKTSSSPGVCAFRSQGVYQPEESLTAFSGSNINGVWTLHVIDDVPATHNGKLVGWGIVIQPEENVFISTPHSIIPPLLLTRILSPYQSVSLNINSPGRIINLIPRIQISQPYERGLLYLPQLVLTHPDGTQVQLSDETYLPCINGNYTYIVFSDTAAFTVYSQCVSTNTTNSSITPDIPVSNSKDTMIDMLRPVTSLSTLVGRRSGGEWLLTAWVSRDTRIHLLGWSMYISTEPNIDTNYDTLTGVFTLAGFDSTENYLTILRSIQYNNTSPSPTFWIGRTVETLLFDGETNSLAIPSSRTNIVLHHIVIDLDPFNVTTALHPGYSTSFIEHSVSTPIVDSGVLLRDGYLSVGLYRLEFVVDIQNDMNEFISVRISNSTNILTTSNYDLSRNEYLLSVYNQAVLYPISVFQTILRSATYSNTADELIGTNRTVTIRIYETSTGIAYPSLEASTYIELVHTNDAPVLILNSEFGAFGDISNFVSYTEGQGTLQLAKADTIILYDNDHGNLQQIVIIITNPIDLLHESLLINESLPNGVNSTYNTDTYTLIIHGRPDTTPRLISFTPFDGHRYGITTNAYVSFASVNDPPLIIGNVYTTSFREEMDPVPIIFEGTKLFDIDNDSLQYIEISIINRIDGANEFIYVNPATTTETISNNEIQYITYTPTLTYPYNDNATVIITGLKTIAEYELVLHTARYDNTADEPQIDTRNISIAISDGLDITYGNTLVMIVLVNDSPRLAQGTIPFVAYGNEDQIDLGISVFETSYLFEDDDLGDDKGIGIIYADCDHGRWQVRGSMLNCDHTVTNTSVNGSSSCALDWLDIPCNLTVDNSFLIRFKANTRLRFIPDLNFYGNSSVTVVAWDGTDEQVDVLIKSAVSTSEIDAFSPEQTTLTFIILPINDAPVLIPIPLVMPSMQEDDFSSVGVSVSTLVINASDVDSDSIGIAIIFVDNTNGVWQYKLNTNNIWNNISIVHEGEALLLDPDSRIRFKPILNFHGSTVLSFKAWDLDQGLTSGSIASTLSTEFSIDNTTVSLTIEPVNDSPILLSADFQIEALYEDIANSLNDGSTISDIINVYYSDIDSVLNVNSTDFGLAVIWVDNTFGVWQYSCNTSGFSWNNFIGDFQYGSIFPELPLADKSTLLLSHCRIRFIPESYFNTELDLQDQTRPISDRPSILVRGWDNTGLTQGRSATYGNDASYATLSNTNEYSTTSLYISVSITSRNNIPILHLTNATTQTHVTTFIEDLSGVRIVSDDVHLVDYDNDKLESLTVTIISGSSNDFLNNSSYCQGIDVRREYIQYNLIDTDLEVGSMSLCPYQLVFKPKSTHPDTSVHIAQYTRVLKTLIFNNDLEEPSPGDRVIEFIVTDRYSTSISSYTFVSVELVNDAPILDLNRHLSDLHNRVSFVEGEGPLLLTNISNINLFDYDSRNLTSAIISLIPSPNMQHEVLSATTTGTNILAYYNYTTAILTLTGSDYIEKYEIVLASITYNNTNTDDPNQTERQVMYTVSDGDKDSILAISYVSFRGINNHPSLDVNGDSKGLDFATVFREEMGPVSIVDSNLSLLDVDNDTLAYVSVRIVNPLDGDSEFLTVDNVTMVEAISSNQLGIPKILKTTVLIANTTFNTSNHELIISGLDSVEEFGLILTTLQYNNIKNEINTEVRVLYFYASDGLLSSALARTNIALERVNDSPYFISSSVLIFPQIGEDDINSSGFSIIQLVTGLINDSDVTDPRGIAVIAAEFDYGIWQYRLDNSSNWLNINFNVSLYDALLLSADSDNYIRFVPEDNFNGNVTISFVAWDSSEGGYVDGNRRSAHQIPRSDINAFSFESRTLTLEVLPINDSPVVQSLTEILMPSILEDEYAYGVTIPFLTTVLDSDVDNVMFGIAIIQTDSINGEWQYSMNNGSSWVTITGVTESTALVFRGNSNERIRFMPELNYNGPSEFTYKLWDLTTPELSGTPNINTLTDPVIGPYSINTATATVIIEAVNDSPLITPRLILSPINENIDTSINVGIPVSTVIDQHFSDVDNNFQSGLAVVGVDHRYGEFEYSCVTTGTFWRPFLGDIAYGEIAPRLPFPSKATLLSDSCRIRFRPNTDFNTQFDLEGVSWAEDIVPYLSVKAWDQTSGIAGDYGVDTTSNPDDITNSFSANTVNITITVISVNRPPVIYLQTADNSFQTFFTEPSPPLRTVYPSYLVDTDSVSITDSDHIHLQLLRVTLTRLDGFSETILYDLSMTNLNASVLADDVNTFTIEFSSSDTQYPALLSYYVMLLKSLRYQNIIEEPEATDRTISFLLVDPESSSSSALTTIFIQLVNDPPELDLDNTTANLNSYVSYTEGQGEFFFLNSSRLSLIDYDSNYLQNATITLLNPIDGVYEVLRATSTLNINVTYSNHRLVLTGPAPVAEFISVLLTTSYEHTNSSPGNPNTKTRQVLFSVADDSDRSISAVTYISFSSENDAPILDLNGNQPGEDYSTVFYEQQGSIRILSADRLLLMDIDNSTLEKITVKLFSPTADDFLFVDNVTLYSDNPKIAKIVILTNLRSRQQFNVSTGELVITGLDYVHEYETVLKTLRYDNSADETGSFVKTLSVIASDGLLDSNEAFIYINVTPVNDAPTINLNISVIRTVIEEDILDSINIGVSISSIIDPIFSDVDSVTQPGLAIVAADTSIGYWEYIVIPNNILSNSSNSSIPFTVPSNSTWIQFPTVVSPEYVLLLKADGEYTRVRFVPGNDYNGGTSISFVAWDGSDSFSSGQIVSLTNSDPQTGAFSTEDTLMFIDITPVNDAPVLETIPSPTFSIREGEYNSFGISVFELVSRVTDVDTNSQQEFGLAVVMNDNSNGTWEYTTTGGIDWDIVESTTPSIALLLSSTHDGYRIRFVPDLNFYGERELSYLAWDLTSGGESGTYASTIRSDPITSPFSSSVATLILTIESVNDSPYFDGNSLLDIVIEDMINFGTAVSDIVRDSFRDIDDGYQVGIAVTNVDNRYGKWEWRCDDLQDWQDFIGDIVFGVRTPFYPIPLRATLLAGECTIRFLPNLNFNTEKYTTGLPRPSNDLPYISILAWDLTTGISGTYGVDTTYHNSSDTNEFSHFPSTAYIHVMSVNDLPSVQISQQGVTYSTIFREDGGIVAIVEPAQVFITDADHSTLESIEIILEQVYDDGYENISLSPNPGVVKIGDEVYVNTTVNNTERLIVTSGQIGDVYQFVLSNPNPWERGSVAAYQTVIRTLVYNNYNSEPTNMTRFIRFYVSDGEEVNSYALTTIYVELIVENIPVLNLGISQITLTEDFIESRSIVSQNLTLTDIDHNEFFYIISANIFFDQTPESILEYISISLPYTPCNMNNNTFSPNMNQSNCTTSPLISSYDPIQGRISINGPASLDVYRDTLKTVVYTNRIGEPIDLEKIIIFEVFDTNNLKSDPVSVRITIELRNDQPPILTAGGLYQYIEQQPTNAYSLFIGDNITYTDADSGNEQQYSVSISITNPSDVPYEILSANPPSASITVEYHTLDVIYMTTQLVEICTNVTDNSTTSTVIDTTGNTTTPSNITTNMIGNNTNTTSSPTTLPITPAPVVLRCENVSGTVNMTNKTTIYTGLNLVGPAYISEFLEALTTVTYSNGAEEPTPTPRRVTFQANDMNLTSNQAEITIRILLTNDLPVVDLNGFMIGTRFMVTFEEGSEPVPIVDSLSMSISDNDHTGLIGATITLNTIYDKDMEILSVNTLGSNLLANYNMTTGILSISGNASIETYQSVLRTLTYVNLDAGPGAPNPHMREITVIVSDPVDSSVPAYSVVTFLSVNDPPFLDLNGNLIGENATANFIEEGERVRVFSPDAVIMDVDNGTLASLDISINNPVDGESERIFINPDIYTLLNPMGSIQITNHSIVLTNFLSTNKYIMALQSIYYVNTLDEPSYDTRYVSVVASDGLLTNALSYVGSITIQPVNDLPQFSFNADPNSYATFEVVYQEDTNSIPVVNVVSTDFILIDDDDPFLTRIIIERSPAPDGDYEKLFFLSSNPIPGLGHTYPQCPLQSISNPLTLDITVSLTLEEWRTALSTLSYCNMDPNSFGGVRQVKIVLVDSKGGRSAVRYSNINVIPINDPPLFTGTPPLVTTDEDNSVQIQVLSNFTDYEEVLTGTAIEIVTQPARGIVQVIQPSGVIQYTPALNDNGIVTLQFRACDSEANCSLPITATIMITPINDPPTPVGSNLIAVEEDGEVQVNLLDYFTDVEDTPTTNNTRVVVTPRGGNWEYNMEQEIFFYSPNLNRIVDDSLEFEGCDNDGLCINITLTFKITPINDLPIITINYPNFIFPAMTNEDTPVNISVSIEDVEDNDELEIQVLSVENGGVRVFTLSTVIQQTNVFLQLIHVEYTPNSNFYGDESIVFSATDNEGGVSTQTLLMRVMYINDPPTIENTVITLDEDTAIDLTLPQGLGISDSESVITSQQIELLTDPDTVLGDLSYNSDNGILSYSPLPNFHTDSIDFTIRVCDTDTVDEIQCSEFDITIMINSINDPPIFIPFIFFIREDSSNTTNILPYLRDVEDVTLSPARISLTGPAPFFGTADYNTDTGDVMYTPGDDFFGQDFIDLRVCDSNNLCSSIQLEVYVIGVNDAPMADGLRHFSPEDRIDLVNIATIVRDVDTIQDVQAIQLRISIVEIVDGNITLVDEGVTNKSGDIRVFQDEGVISYEPPPNFIGYDKFKFAVCDHCDESRNPELGRTTLEDIECLNQIEENNGQSIDPLTGLSIACSVGTITIVVVNNNDVPLLRDISAVTNINEEVVLDPFGSQLLFDDMDLFVYDEDDSQAAYALSQGFDLNELVLSNSSNIDTGVIGILSSPIGGNAVISGTDRVYMTYTPFNNFIGYDEFLYEVCDISPISACGNAIARVFVSSSGPHIDMLVVSGSQDLPDSKVSRGDTITISFSEPTNQPPQEGKDSMEKFCGSAVDQVITFDSPFIDSTIFPNAYCARWDDPTTLIVSIIDRGYPEPDPKIGQWIVSVTQDPSRICSGFDSNHQRFDENGVNTNCLFNADSTSAHSISSSPPATGDWGLILPRVLNAIIQNINIRGDGTLASLSQSIQPGTSIKIHLSEPFSSSQLLLYCQIPISDLLNFQILFAGTRMTLQACSNLLADGSNADQVYNERDPSSLSSLGFPMLSELIFEVISLDPRLIEETQNSNQMLSRFLQAVRQAPIAKVVEETLNVKIDVPPDAVVGQIGTINPITENVDVNTPTVISAVASDPDNFDNVYSNFDVIRITFSVATNEPAVGSKDDMDKIFIFTPTLGVNYLGAWETSSILLVIIIDSSRPEVNGTEPTIANLMLEFLPNYLNNETIVLSSSITSDKFHCIGDNVCSTSSTAITIGVCDSTKTSCRANTPFTAFSGDFGTATGVADNPIGIIAGTSVAVIIVIVVLAVIILLLLLYYCYKRVQEKRDRDKALALVRSWKQKQKAHSEQQKKTSMLGVDESWKSPSTMPLMRGNVDPFSSTAPKLSMGSGAFISPTPYEPFQPRAYPSILDSSLGYPTVGSALPPITLRTPQPDGFMLPAVSPAPLSIPPVIGPIRPAPGLPPIKPPATMRSQFPMEGSKPGPIPGMLIPSRLPTMDQTPTSLPPLVQPKSKFPDLGKRHIRSSDVLTTTTTEGTTTETTEGSTESVSGSSVPPPKTIGLGMPSRKTGVDPYSSKPLSPIPGLGMRAFDVTPILATPLIPTSPQKPPTKPTDQDDEGPTSETTE
ncbi:hypothetical protein LOD99_2290 [Oopsacas minuta]|uniref:RanBP-type and C3HC4-type zinc finger-containing protein 1 n=1 Tax=Oopsacas minuta TaxID=111878 RepID=A0AAV7K3Y3_9METZ|nr:hypothetical protein LOD99_2290 [Oopsacas minuta]